LSFEFEAPHSTDPSLTLLPHSVALNRSIRDG
jgi:hypothetical protein